MSQPLPNPVFTQAFQTSHSPSQSRPYTLQQVLSNDILFDLTPSKTLEALTSSPSILGKSIETISPNERAFGIRAAAASQKIHEWLEELSLWPWLKNSSSASFDTTSARKREHYTDQENMFKLITSNNGHGFKYKEFLTDLDINQLEKRLEEIQYDLENLRVDEIKRQVLDTHIIARSRPSSSCSRSPLSSFFSSTSYTKMDDFTAIIIATVLQALPKLSRLVALMEIWGRRLFILKKIPILLMALEDAEIALGSGWNTIRKLELSESSENGQKFQALSRDTFDVMRYVLEEKVTTLGQSLDFMLNTLEGSQDSLPDSWLDRMENLEKKYGEWVVACESIVRRGELLKSDNSHNMIGNTGATGKETEFLSSKYESVPHGESSHSPECSSVSFVAVKPKKDLENLGLIDQKGSIQLESVRALPKFTIEKESQGLILTSTTKAETKEILKNETCSLLPDVCKNIPALSSSQLEFMQPDFNLKSSQVKKNELIARKDDYLIKSPPLKQKLYSEIRSSTIVEQTLDHNLAENSSKNEDVPTLPIRNKDLNDKVKSQNSKIFLSDAPYQNQQFQAVAENPDLDNRSISFHNQNPPNAKELSQNFCPISKSSQSVPKVDAISISNSQKKSQMYPITETANKLNLDRIREQTPVKLCAIDLHTEASSRNISRKNSCHGQKFQNFEANSILNDSIVTPNRPAPISSSSKTPSNSHSSNLNLDDKSDVTSSALVYPANSDLEHINALSLGNKNFANPTPANIIKHEEPLFSELPASQFDGCSESRFVNGVDTEDDSLNRSRIVLSPSQNQRLRLKPVPNSDMDQSDIMKSVDLKKNEYSIDDSMVTYPRLADNSPITSSPPSFKIILKGEAGKNYSVELPSNGTTIFTNNLLLVSTIFSDINVSALCDIKSRGSTLSLISGPPGTFKVAPPQTIFSITYRALATSVLKTKNSRFESNLSMENKSNETPCFTRPTSKITSKKLSYVLNLPQTRNTASYSHIAPVMEEEAKISPQLPEESVECNDYSVNSNQNQKETFFGPSNNLVLTANVKSLYLPKHHRKNTTTNYLNDFVESSVDSLPLCENSPGIEKSMPVDIFPKNEHFPINGQANTFRKDCFNISPPESPVFKTQKPRSSSSSPEFPNPQKNRIDPGPQLRSTSPISKARSTDGAKGVKNDQFQQQISSLLESIPTLVCLSTESEPKTLGPETLRPRGTRQSLSHNNRPSSSLSNHGPPQRASTPPFTLIPAHGKGMSRSRHQNSNSEIRIYHLSRSNGEAPIKLFVRLVGEHGERVMVRVGGGWADLGEYLREYASHHCRRTDTDTIKIQDPPSRKSSMGTLKTSTTNWETGSSSPLQKPQSVIGEIHRNSLNVQKTRRSIGSTSAECLVKQSRAGGNSRCPSTPLPVIKHSNYDTPPSASSSSGTVASVSVVGTSDKSQRMSWIEEDFNLGLAGPRSKKSFISDRDQEWVESMQEKVRLASAEKEKRNRCRAERAEKLDRNRTRGLSLDGMERIGGTIRFFKKDGSAA